jgi:predicted GIY-YIG superfamily endonuclease
MKMTWDYVQGNSNKILSDGIYQLLKAANMQLTEVTYKGYGNYLIFYKAQPLYIGEAKSIKARLKQHASLKSSTFYKNYRDIPTQLPANLEITDFHYHYLQTDIGRKEMEEFGIVNIPTLLNKFQKGKRTQYPVQSHKNLWQHIQTNKENFVQSGELALNNIQTTDWNSAEPPQLAGLYWIEHATNGLIYIGESSDISERFNSHSTRTYISAFRRNLGTTLLDFKLKTKKGRKRYFSKQEENELNRFIEQCFVRFMPIQFGRYELEEYLINKYQPLLNRKGKRKKPL